MKISGVVLAVLASGQFATAMAVTMDFKNFVFPELKTDRAELASAYNISRRLTIADGKIIRDDIKQTDIVYSEEELPKDYCLLDVQYQITKGDLPSGQIVLPSAQYDLKAVVETGSSWTGPIVLGSDDPVDVYTSNQFRSVSNAYGYAQVPVKVMGKAATFILVSVQCKGTVARDMKGSSNPEIIGKAFGGLATVQ
ncbi:MAG: hypothetical protein JST80_03140 [Bdellovibrionales bacterium]|nr:hypothetical protein [Bdellovibrionales bacterium]